MRSGRIRRASLTSRRRRTSPVPSRLACRVCIETTSGSGTLSSKTSSQVTTRSRAGIAAARQLSKVVFPAWVPPATMMLRPARHCGFEEVSRGPGHRLQRHQLVQRRRSEDELADVHRPMNSGDVRDHHVQTAAVGQHRVDERGREIDPAAGRLQHLLDQVTDLGVGENDRGQLAAPTASDEHPAGAVDPDLLDRRVLEQPLQRTEPGYRVVDDPRRVKPVLAAAAARRRGRVPRTPR